MGYKDDPNSFIYRKLFDVLDISSPPFPHFIDLKPFLHKKKFKIRLLSDHNLKINPFLLTYPQTDGIYNRFTMKYTSDNNIYHTMYSVHVEGL